MSLKVKNGRLAELIGSPNCLSPLDRIRTGKRERAAQFGIDIRNEESFEANQSFPRIKSHVNKNKKKFSKEFKFSGNELNSISFLPTFKKQYKNKYDQNTNSASLLHQTSGCSDFYSENLGCFDKSWQFYNHFAAQNDLQLDEQHNNFTKSNANKALITINGRNSEILTANDVACNLFDYSEDNLIGMKLKDLLDKNSQYKHDIVIESHLDDFGDLVLCSGKLFDAIDSNNIVMPISIYMQKLTTNENNEPICLCVIEPVQRTTGYFKINVKGNIRHADEKFSNIFGYVNQQNSIIGKDISELIPSLKLPICGITKETKKQTLTGRTLNHMTIPLTVRIHTKQLFNNEEIVYNCSVNLYSNISGLITACVSDGHINSYNPTFTRILFGYDDDVLKNKPITDLIPNFYASSSNNPKFCMSYDDEDEENKSFNSKSIDSSNFSSKEPDSLDSDSDTNKTAKYCVKCGSELEYNQSKFDAVFDNILNYETPKRKCLNFIEKNDFKPQTPQSITKPKSLSTSICSQNDNDVSLVSLNESIDDDDDKHVCDECLNSNKAETSILQANDGDEDDGSDVSLIAIDDDVPHSAKKSGYYRKRDANNVPIITISTNNQASNTNITDNKVTSTPAAVTTNEKKRLLNKNLDDGTFYGLGKHSDGSLINIIYQRKLVEIRRNNYLLCIWIMKNPDLEKSIMEHTSMDQSHLRRSFVTSNESFQQVTQYSQEYEDIGTLGRGASGFVQFAKRRIDSFEVVTKYIKKKKIHKDSWINDDRYGQIPLEISILCKLEHKNIIKVLDIFQDNDYIQMVMEKHGCGMDLFEFIDRQPRIDEQLASYIFRQLASAVAHLHANNIVHRDIKDENIVINESFHIKLIDFGSAAYMIKGKKFATFCGTLDYCSPEVLIGNKYYGPELDSWTLGIVLYTLVFSENPFFDADETIECMLKPPFKVSKELMKLLFSILCPKPEIRATIRDIETDEWVTQYVDMQKYKWESVIKNTVFYGNNAGDCRGGDSELDESLSVRMTNNKVQDEEFEDDVENQVLREDEMKISDKHSRSF